QLTYSTIHVLLVAHRPVHHRGHSEAELLLAPDARLQHFRDYAEGPNGKHLVQYFDKSRMEINNPNGDKSNPFYVTNGLLTEELIYGRIQTGNNKYEFRYPAEINLASDGDDTGAGTPTYASFRSVVYGQNQSRVGETIADTK